MNIVIRELGINVPKFKIPRKIVAEYNEEKGGEQERVKVVVKGVDEDGIMASFVKGVVVIAPLKNGPTSTAPVSTSASSPQQDSPAPPSSAPPGPPPPPPKLTIPTPSRAFQAPTTETFILHEEPFAVTLDKSDVSQSRAKIRFMGHYDEPQIELTFQMPAQKETSEIFEIEFDPETGSWASTKGRSIKQL